MSPMKPDQKKDSDSSSIENPTLSPTSQALHADDHLNSTSDIAPPLHVSTNFHYPTDPDDLIPVRDLDVSSPLTPSITSITNPLSSRW